MLALDVFFKLHKTKLFALVFFDIRFEPKMDEVSHYKWVPFTTAWRILKLRMEERSSVWRVAAIILN